MNEAKLDGKNCVITGATGGIGKKISEILASNGCNLFLISTNEKKLSELRLQIENSSNVKIHTFATDLSILENLKNTISEVRNFFEKVDILINSAGIFNVDPLLNSTIEKFEKNFNLNVRAPFYLARIFSQDMVQQKWGRIVNLGSSSTRTDMGKISSDQNFETFLDPSDVAESIKFVISFDENLVIDEIRLNRMKIE